MENYNLLLLILYFLITNNDADINVLAGEITK